MRHPVGKAAHYHKGNYDGNHRPKETIPITSTLVQIVCILLVKFIVNIHGAIPDGAHRFDYRYRFQYDVVKMAASMLPRLQAAGDAWRHIFWFPAFYFLN